MNVLMRLMQMEKLTSNEETLVALILSQPSDLIEMKPIEIAKKAFVSVSTLYRLIDKLGYNGLNDFKGAIVQALLQTQVDSKLTNYDFPIMASDSIQEIAKSLSDVYERTIKETSLLIDDEQMNHISKKMIEAEKIDVYAASANIYFAQNFQFQMQEIGVDVNVPLEDYMQRLTASNSDYRHFSIVVSYGGRGTTTRAVIDILKTNQTPVLLISSTQNNPLVQESDFQIYMSSFEHHSQKISSFSTRMSLLYIFDLLYASYFRQDYIGNQFFKQEHYKKMNQFMK